MQGEADPSVPPKCNSRVCALIRHLCCLPKDMGTQNPQSLSRSENVQLGEDEDGEDVQLTGVSG